MEAFLTQLNELIPDGELKTQVLIQVLKDVDPSIWTDEKLELLRQTFPEMVEARKFASWLYDPCATLEQTLHGVDEEKMTLKGQVADNHRYTEPASIWEVLKTGHVRLVRKSWLIEHSRAGQILPRRQDLPNEAFIDVNELQEIYEDGTKEKMRLDYSFKGDVLPIVVISFCWLTPKHPDPYGQQLATVAAALEREQDKYIFKEMAVFWDWVSLYQKDVDGNRTEEEKQGFTFALEETMDLWYAHQGTHVYLLTKLPENAERKIGYADSGWTTYERCSAEQIKKFYVFAYNAKLVLDLGAEEGAEQMRNWPIGPDDFDKLIEQKTFTNGADRHEVKKLFRKMSAQQLGGIEELDFDGMKQPSVEDGRRLGGCLKLCAKLRGLDLSRVGMTSEALNALASSLGEGALGACETLCLLENKIGDAGMRGLAEALGRGALGTCQVLDLPFNRIGDDGMQAIKDATKPISLEIRGLVAANQNKRCV